MPEQVQIVEEVQPTFRDGWPSAAVRKVEPFCLHACRPRVDSILNRRVSRPEHDIPRWYATDVGSMLVLAEAIKVARDAGNVPTLNRAVDAFLDAFEAPPQPVAEPKPVAEKPSEAKPPDDEMAALIHEVATATADQFPAAQKRLQAAMMARGAGVKVPVPPKETKQPEKREAVGAGRK